MSLVSCLVHFTIDHPKTNQSPTKFSHRKGILGNGNLETIKKHKICVFWTVKRVFSWLMSGVGVFGIVEGLRIGQRNVIWFGCAWFGAHIL